MLGSVLDGHQRRTTPLAADAKALCKAQHDEQNRCPDADRGVAGQQPHQHRRRAHEQQRVDQHRLAADLVAVMGEDGAAEGPRDEPDGERSESGQGPGHRIKGWEEDLVEDQGRGGAEDEEVVPLDRRADEAGEGHLARRVGGRPIAGPVRGVEVVSVFSSIWHVNCSRGVLHPHQTFMSVGCEKRFVR